MFDNLSHEGSDKVRLGDEYVHIRSYLERFLFDGARQRQAAGSLSGGERARLALAKMLRGGANLVVLDEPTTTWTWSPWPRSRTSRSGSTGARWS